MYLVVDQPEIALPEPELAADLAEPVADQPELEQHRVADNKLPRQLDVLLKFVQMQ